MRVVTREYQIDREHSLLDGQATCSDEADSRAYSCTPDLLRNEFQRDRDKILHCKAFRRLSHKTQVFVAPLGDHFRTRLTHTLEVSQIARTIARGLCLNEDLTEAISLGHDLGHTPFGHAGERVLQERIRYWREQTGTATDANERYFAHNLQSLRVVEHIENNGRGLNLTEAVRDGILYHTGDQPAETLEGRIVARADRIAYVNHDIDDAIRAGVLTEADLPRSTKEILGSSHSQRIERMVYDAVEHSASVDDIVLSEEVWNALMELRTFLFERVYHSPQVSEEVMKAQHLIRELFDYFMTHESAVPTECIEVAEGDLVQAVTDHIAGMTDRYAKTVYQDVFIPQSLNRQ